MVTYKRDLASGVGLLIFSVLLFLATFTIKKLFIVSRIGAAFVPQLAAVILAGLSIMLIAQSLHRKNLAETDDNPTEKVIINRSVWLSIGLLVIYGALLGPLGFILSTIGYLFCQIFILFGNRKKPLVKILLTSVLASIIVYLIFVYAFELMLPAGLLG